jgi:alkylation response protein AidB-like acyl-CoA dehydrogenase
MPGAANPGESTLYLVRPGSSVKVSPAGFDGLGLRGNDSAPVKLESHEVAPGDLLSEQGKSEPLVMGAVLPWFAIGTAAMANGICRAAFAATQRHIVGTGFQHTGTLLRDLHNLRVRLATISVRTDQSRALLGHTLDHLEAPSEITPLFVLESRLAALTAALDVTDLAMKTCGGAAFSKHLPVERLFRDARAGWVMAPTVDHLEDFIGRALTGMPLFG